MAKIICANCKKSFSDNLTSCPKCGWNIYTASNSNLKQKKNNKFALIVLCVLGFGYVVMSIDKATDSKEVPNNFTSRQEVNVETQPIVENIVEEATSAQMAEEMVEEIPEETKEEYIASCSTDFKYKDVLRNPDNYIGQRIAIDLRISVVKKENMLNSKKYYFAYSESEYGWYGDEYAVIDYTDNELKILEDDIIRVWGEIAEPEDTISYITNSQEIFCINMKYVELLEE